AETSAAISVAAQDVVALRSLNDTVQLARAANLVSKDQYAEAIEPLQIYLTTASHDARTEQALSTLAICLMRSNRIDDAQRTLMELRKQFPQSKQLVLTAAQIADAAYDAGQFKVAADLFAELATSGGSPEIVAKGLAGIGWCRYQLGDFEGANFAMEQFLEKFPTDGAAPETALMRGQALEKLKKDDQAAIVYRQALKRYPQTKQMPQLLLAAARLYDRIGQDEEAVPIYDRVVREYPKSPDVDAVLYDLAWSLRDLGRANDSDKVFHKLCDEHPGSKFYGDATYRLAERASQHSENDMARGLLAPLLAKEDCPADVREHALYLMAQMAIGEEKWCTAEPFLTHMVQSFPDGKLCVPAQFWLAEIAFRSGDYAMAQERFDAVAPQVSDHSEPWMAIVPLRRAQILAGQKQWAAARTMAETVAQDYPKFDRLFEADYVIGRALAAEEKYDEARTAFTRVVQSASGGKTETAAMAQLKIADAYFQQDDYQAALREYLRVDTLYGFPHWQASALLQAARCYEKLGQQKDAGELYARVLQSYPQTEFVAEASRKLMETTRK
ncbi:MAG TPA: tetratricopeptide repeat protein, partial [Pirellulales bacterium]